MCANIVDSFLAHRSIERAPGWVTIALVIAAVLVVAVAGSFFNAWLTGAVAAVFAALKARRCYGVTAAQTDSSGAKFVQWVNPAAFAQPTAGAFGNLARNKYYGPRYGSVDFSVYKDTKITERISTQFRVEIFNLFNRVNLAPPSNYTGGGFGQVTDTIGDYNGAPGIGPGEPFNLQLALKIIF